MQNDVEGILDKLASTASGVKTACIFIVYDVSRTLDPSHVT